MSDDMVHCKRCGKPIHPSLWFSRTFELTVRVIETLNDGMPIVRAEDAGVFCSRGCLIDYLTDGSRQEAEREVGGEMK
ncbi:MAG: hypothetical protein AB1760_00100 [Pseudomonadota bacterium]